MKNVHQFYLITFLLSLHSVVFCSQQRIPSTIQADKKNKTTARQNWDESLKALEQCNNHAKPQTVFPRIENMISDHNKKSSSSTQAHASTVLPPINTKKSQQTDPSSQKKSHRRRKNIDSFVLKYKFAAENCILDDLDKLLSESAVTISPQITPRDLFTLTEETEEDLTVEDNHDENNLLLRKQFNASKNKLHKFLYSNNNHI